MKIVVGKAYEGASSMRLKDGDYELRIDEVQSTKGRVNMTLTTSTGQKIYKTFFLLDKDGKTQNERGMRELADYVTTAMQIEEQETEVTVESCVGFYLLCYVKNGSYTKADGTIRAVYNTYSPRRCKGFSESADDEEQSEESEEVEDVAEEEEATAEINEETEDILKKLLG